MQARPKQKRPPNHLLKRQRELRGWSREQMAKELQARFPGIAVTEDYIRRWEDGKRRPGPYYRPKLCTLFETTADKLGLIPQDVSSDQDIEADETAQEDGQHANLEAPTIEEVICRFTELFHQQQAMMHQVLRWYEQTNQLLEENGLQPTEVIKDLAERLRAEKQRPVPPLISFSSEAVPVPQAQADANTTNGVTGSPFDSPLKIRREDDQDLEGKSMDKDRRLLLQHGIELVGARTFVPAMIGSFDSNSSGSDFLASPFSPASLHNLTVITQQFREMHRRGDPFFWPGLHAHIRTIQDILTNTTEDTKRREIWRLLAQNQLLVRLGCQPNSAKRLELARGKTSNELAIAYAQQSGDMALKGGTIGHLAQFYLRQEPDEARATQYVNEARPFSKGNEALIGWLSLLQASIDAKAGRVQQCEEGLTYAIERAHNLPPSPEYSDAYYTDFSLISAQVFCINCWLIMGNSKKAQVCFTETNLADLSENRQASTFYDVSRMYAALGDFDLTQTYAFQAIDKAIRTHQLYVISRCRKLATTILEKERHEPHATAILEYMQSI